MAPLAGETQPDFLARVREAQGGADIPLGTLGDTRPETFNLGETLIGGIEIIGGGINIISEATGKLFTAGIGGLIGLGVGGAAGITGATRAGAAPFDVLTSGIRGAGAGAKVLSEQGFELFERRAAADVGTAAEPLLAATPLPDQPEPPGPIDPFQAPPGSAGAVFRNEMLRLAGTAALGETAAERNSAAQRLRTRLSFLNMGFGGRRAQFDAAVANQVLQFARGNYADIVSDAITRELPWKEWGEGLGQDFETYKDFLEFFGYEDLGNGTWRRLRKATEAEFPVGAFPSSPQQDAFAPFPGFGQQRGFIGLVNWRI